MIEEWGKKAIIYHTIRFYFHFVYSFYLWFYSIFKRKHLLHMYARSVRVRLLLLIAERLLQPDSIIINVFLSQIFKHHLTTKPTTNHVTNFNLMVRLIFIILEFIAFEFHWTDELKLLTDVVLGDLWCSRRWIKTMDGGRLLVLFYAYYGGSPIPCPSASILLISISKYN